MLTGYLKSIAVNVKPHSVTQSRAELTGFRMRWFLIIGWPKYHAPTPNSLFHLESPHNLMYWGLVIY